MNTSVTIRYSNESAEFSCEANNGSGDIQYSWFTKTDDGDMMIVGATSSQLVLTPVTVEMNNTQYYCVAINDSGSVRSNRGYLTVYFAIGTYVFIKLAIGLLNLLSSMATVYACVCVCVVCTLVCVCLCG